MVENCQDDGDDGALLLQDRLDAELYQICVVRPADDGDDEDHRQALGHAHAAAAKSASKWQTHFEIFLFCFQTTRTVNIDLRYLWLSFWVLGLFWKINLTFSALYVYWFLWFYFGDQNHIHSLFQVLFVFFNIFVYFLQRTVLLLVVSQAKQIWKPRFTKCLTIYHLLQRNKFQFWITKWIKWFTSCGIRLNKE